jgi:hypothetical protein
VQQLVVRVPAVVSVHFTLGWELALSFPVLFQTAEADVDIDVLGTAKTLVRREALELAAVYEVVLPAALRTIFFLLLS